MKAMEHIVPTTNNPGKWPDNTKGNKLGLCVVLFCAGLSILWSYQMGWKSHGDFQAIYYGSRTLILHHNPYSITELDGIYQAETRTTQPITAPLHHSITLFVNTPGTLLLMTPFAALPLQVSQMLWTILSAGSLVLGCVLMWRVGAERASGLSTFLAGFLILNCEFVFEVGNSAALVIGLCAIATWCFLQERFNFAGVVCMAISVAMKPHDSGLVLLYFLLADLACRKRALQSAVMAGIISLVAIVWLSTVAPGWMHDWRSNLALISTPGEINDPRPANVSTGLAIANVISLQAVFSVFSESSSFFNAASYLVCGGIILPWLIITLRSRNSQTRAWLALAAIVPLTMLVTYHRVSDAKLLMLCIPACAMLWSRRGRIGWTALVLTSLGIAFSADIPLAILEVMLKKLHLTTSTLSGQILTVLIVRPSQLALLAMSLFYLWVYMRKDVVLPALGDLDHASQATDAPVHVLV